MNWRPAASLVTLRDQVNSLYPGRNKASDGLVGDSAHAATVSDHNPDAAGVVAAFDITHDPAHGLDIWELANDLKADYRVKYLIANSQIFIDGRWQKYSGADPHTNHVHVSVRTVSYDDPSLWPISNQGELSMTPEVKAAFDDLKSHITLLEKAVFGTDENAAQIPLTARIEDVKQTVIDKTAGNTVTIPLDEFNGTFTGKFKETK